jgi:Uma2 family endonuclease
MTQPALAFTTELDLVEVDQRVYLRDVSWQAYEALLAWRGDSSVPRMTYLEGVLELMSPARSHEIMKTRLARLLEAWAEEKGIAIEGAGSWTVKDPSVDRGAEADECYVLGDVEKAERPQIAIEVVWTRGGIKKLEVWRKLGVAEVWIWQKGALTFHLLDHTRERYAKAPRSSLLPNLDPALLASFMTGGSQTEAVKRLRDAMKTKRRTRATR